MKNGEEKLQVYREIIEHLKTFKNKVFHESTFNHQKDLLQLIIEATSFLDRDSTLSERLYCIFNSITKRLMCPVCKTNPLKFNPHKKCYHLTGCCAKCSKNNSEVKEKTKRTNLQKYGFSSHNSSPEIKEKKRIVCLKKYGVENPSQVPEFIEKRKQTTRKHYDVDSVLRLNEVRQKRSRLSSEDSFNKFILNSEYDEPCFTVEEYHQRKDQTAKLKFRCKKCHQIFETSHWNGFHSRCPNCYRNGKSFYEAELFSFLKSLSISAVEHDRKTLKPLEFDFYVPEKRIAIEFDGLFWHRSRDKKPDLSQLNKTELCESKGIQLIHIFENEWCHKKDIVKSRLKNLLRIQGIKIFARKCEIREVDSQTSKKFQEENHLQGAVNSKVNIGLFFEEQLVSLLTFGKPRFSKKYEWELLRFCNKLDYSAVGAASKLLKYFERNYKPKSLISYADRRWSQGKLYYELGFKLDHISKPDYWYFKNHLRVFHRSMFQKHRLSKLLRTFDPNLSEIQNMENNGYMRIFDCGNMVFAKDYNGKI